MLRELNGFVYSLEEMMLRGADILDCTTCCLENQSKDNTTEPRIEHQKFFS